MPIKGFRTQGRFNRDTKRLVGPELEALGQTLLDLMKDPMPAALHFHPLKGKKVEGRKVYTCHLPGSTYKISLELGGENDEIATLRRYGPHDEIDKAP